MSDVERLEKLAQHDTDASIALTRHNIRTGREAFTGVPFEHKLLAFDACFDMWPDDSAVAISRWKMIVTMGSRGGTDPVMRQLLPCGSMVLTARRLAAFLCNLCRRLPRPSIKRECALTLYFELLGVALGKREAWYDVIRWIMGNTGNAEWVWTRMSYESGVRVARAEHTLYDAWMDTRGTCNAPPEFDASCLPVVPMDIAEG